ncbi:hypothetical protein Cva_01656 [Caedimonas varicaedens]|uniref:Uncharacterized protein n=1 Tax=Caedimonas varicaedens TaxID=1629334 RepID=A0A0K8MEP7_9PROT|nr:hypothetical protein Cva_01656 [Caedimonas varicaedens]
MLPVPFHQSPRLTYEHLKHEPDGYFMHLHSSDYQALLAHVREEIEERIQFLNRIKEPRKLYGLVMPHAPQRRVA